MFLRVNQLVNADVPVQVHVKNNPFGLKDQVALWHFPCTYCLTKCKKTPVNALFCNWKTPVNNGKLPV